MADYSKQAIIDVIFDPQLSKKTVASITGDAYFKKGTLNVVSASGDYITLKDNPELFSWRVKFNATNLTTKVFATTGIEKDLTFTAGSLSGTTTGFNVYVNGVLNGSITLGENEVVGIATGSFTYTAIKLGEGIVGSMSLFQVFKSVISVEETLNKYEAKEFKEHLNTNNRILSVDGRDGIIGNRLEGDIVGSPLVSNGYFESNITGWSDLGANQTLERNTTSPIFGNGDLHCVTNASGSSAVGTGLGTLTNGRTYRISFTYRAVSGTVRGKIGTTDAVGSAVFTGGWTDNSLNESSNTFINTTFVAGETSDAYIILFATVTGTEFYIDNVTLTEIIPAVVNTSVVSVRDGSIYANYYNGSTSKLDCGNYDDLTGDKSFIAWIKPYGLGEGGFGRIFNNSKLLMWIEAAGSFAILKARSDGSTVVQSASGVISASHIWWLIILTRTASGVSNFYVNGILSGTADQAGGTPVAGTTNILIGNSNGNDRTFYGLINQNRIEDSILTAQTVMQIYTSEKGQYGL